MHDKKEAIYLAIAFAATITAFQIIFLKENFLANLRTVTAIYWLYIVPGLTIMYNWEENLDFLERFVIGTVLGLAINGAIGYNLTLLGIHMKYHAAIIPTAMLGAAILLGLWRKKPIKTSA